MEIDVRKSREEVSAVTDSENNNDGFVHDEILQEDENSFNSIIIENGHAKTICENKADNDDTKEADETKKYTFKTVKDSHGREHVVTGRTGEAVIFLAPNSIKPSSIEAHCNDMMTVLEAYPEKKKKKALIMTADDGGDWGIRSEATFFHLGMMMRDAELDFVLLTKYAPGQSRLNPVEHMFAPVTRRLSSVILYPSGGGEDKDQEENIGPDSSQPDIKETDDDIMKVKCLLKDFKYDGYNVETVAVKCNSDQVQLGGKILDNRKYKELDQIQRFFHKKPTKSAMKNLTPEEEKIRKHLSWTVRHMDKRSHQIILRKCMKSLGEKVCSWCKKNPPQLSSEFIAALPPR